MEPPSSTPDDYFSLGITLILVLLFYAFIKGCELAYFTLSNKDRENLESMGTRRSQRVLRQLSNSGYLSWTILQIEILLQVSAVILTAELFNRVFSPDSYLFLLAILVLVITIVLLKYSGNALIGTLSKEGRVLEFTLRASGVFSLLLFITKPFNIILSNFTEALSESREERDAQSIEEYTEVVDATDKEEVEEKKILKGIVSLNTTSVSQIMKPRVEIVSLDMDMTSQQVVNKAIECGFSRLPVYEKSPDNIRGFLYIKDLIGYLSGNVTDFDWHKHIREAYFVPGSKKINDLLEEFRQKKMHLALVVDEYGGTDGLVTLEDILEEIVGEISDETDKNE